MRRLTGLIALALTLAACSQGDQAAMTGGEMIAVETTHADADSASDGEDSAEPGRSGDLAETETVSYDATDGRRVIRRASLHLRAPDTRATFEEIVRLVESTGGFVASAHVSPSDGGEDDQPNVEATLRIPADGLTTTLAAIKETADEVVSESQTAEDVTEQFVDLEARLRNLRALEVELRALLTEVRRQPDADPQKLLTVFNELSSVRGEIEQAQGRLNHLGDLTALATVNVSISQTPETAPIVEQPWQPAAAAREALSSLVSSLQGVADWAINFALFALPMLLVFIAPPAALGYVAYRRWSRRDPGDTPRPGPETVV